MFRNRDGGCASRDRDRHARPSSCLEIDFIDTDSPFLNEFQTWCLSDHFSGHKSAGRHDDLCMTHQTKMLGLFVCFRKGNRKRGGGQGANHLNGGQRHRCEKNNVWLHENGVKAESGVGLYSSVGLCSSWRQRNVAALDQQDLDIFFNNFSIAGFGHGFPKYKVSGPAVLGTTSFEMS